MTNRVQAAKILRQAATKIQRTRPDQAEELFAYADALLDEKTFRALIGDGRGARFAQVYGDATPVAGEEFDPSAETPLVTAAGGLGGEAGALADEMEAAAREGHEPAVPNQNYQGGQPQIESFVHEPDQPMVIGNNMTVQKAQVTFEAPQDVSHGKIMQYMMGIEDELGVKVTGFVWNTTDAEPKGQKAAK